MAKMGRPGLSDAEKTELWRLWGSGNSISEIAQEIDRAPGSIFTVLCSNGGYVPPDRVRRAGYLTFEEREEISRGLATKQTFTAIAETLGRSTSTVSREVNGNGGRDAYRAAEADQAAWDRAKRPQQCLLAREPELADYVRERLEEEWSPEQIAGHLALEPVSGMTVSHETIYKTLFIRTRKVFKPSLAKKLRTRRPTRRNNANRTKGKQRSVIKNAVSIHERTGAANQRSEPGHWEGDLIIGAKVSQIGTIVDRATGFTVLVQLDGRDARTVCDRVGDQLATLPADLRGSLTWDRGMELAAHERVTAKTGVPVFFCDPRSPWQRGTNENTNGLLRQYFPKKTSMHGFTQHDLDAVAHRLNTRPRKRLGYRTPAATLAAMLQ